MYKYVIAALSRCKGKIMPIIVACSLFNSPIQAEGSKDLYPSGATGYRAYLMSRLNLESAHFAPFQTPGRTKVYAKPGEKIYIGFSMQGKTLSGNTGHIVVRKPNGTLYGTSGTSKTVGLIANRAEELGGPFMGTGTKPSNKYRPYVVTVGTGDEGVWEIDFMSIGSGTNHSSSTNLLADANWVQSTESAGSALIAAWDVTVAKASTNEVIEGRVFTTLFVGTTINSQFHLNAFYGKFYVLTPDGFSYLVDGNGMNGASFSFFSNNKGPKNTSTGVPNYKSFSYPTSGDLVSYISSRIWDPRGKDAGSDVTNKLFYNKPAADLPAHATWTNGPVSGMNPTTTTWLKPAEFYAEVSDLELSCDGTIQFNTNKSINYTLEIFIDEDSLIKTFRGSSVEGVLNMINWDKTSETGEVINAGENIKVSVTLNGGEVHFPLIDAESNNNGLKIQLLDANYNPVSGRDTVYWDDSDFTSSTMTADAWSGRSNPLSNYGGRRSTGPSANGHKWSGTGGTSENFFFGNNKVLDTWTYINSENFTAYGTLCMELNGSVWNDVNANGVKDESEVNVSGASLPLAPAIYSGEPLSVYLVNTDEEIIDKTLVDNKGNYAFYTVPAYTDGLKIVLSKESKEIGDTINESQLAEGWIHTSELIGEENSAVQALFADGIINFNAYNKGLNKGFDFGIQQIPTAYTDTVPDLYNPGGDNLLIIQSEYFSSEDYNGGYIDSITITSFPEFTSRLIIDGIEYTASSFPEGGITIPTMPDGKPIPAIALDPMSGDGMIIIHFVAHDNGNGTSKEEGRVYVPIYTIQLSGKIYHDADGMSDDWINGPGTNMDGIYQLVLMRHEDDSILYTTSINEDGTFLLEGIEGNNNFSLILVPLLPSIDDSISSPIAESQIWVHTGERIGNMTGHDGVIDGRIELGYISSSINDLRFGVQHPPLADEKLFYVSTAAFSYEPSHSDFEILENYLSLAMSSEELNAYDTYGSLSGSDPEDCMYAGSCHSATGTTFYIDSIYEGTRLFYDFGGVLGVQEINVSSGSVQIPNFDYEKMMIYGELGYADFGFIYSMQDQAQFISEPVEYRIIVSSVLSVDLLHFTAIAQDKHINVEWIVNEKDVKEYIVMRSADGQSWSAIKHEASKAGAHNSSVKNHYKIEDKQAHTGYNFYQLKMVGISGETKYSPIIKAELKYSPLSINLYPNPVKDYIHIQGLKSSAEMYIYTMSGQLVEHSFINNELSTVSLAHLLTGQYIIQIVDGNTTLHTQTIMVQP